MFEVVEYEYLEMVTQRELKNKTYISISQIIFDYDYPNTQDYRNFVQDIVNKFVV